MELVNGACRRQRSRAPLSQTHVAKGPLTGRYCVRPAYDLGSEFVSFKEISPGERNRQTPGKSRGRRYAKISLVGGVVWLAMEGGVCRASIAQHRVSSRTGGVEGGYIGKKGGGMGVGEAGGPGVIISSGIRSRLGGNGSGWEGDPADDVACPAHSPLPRRSRSR